MRSPAPWPPHSFCSYVYRRVFLGVGPRGTCSSQVHPWLARWSLGSFLTGQEALLRADRPGTLERGKDLAAGTLPLVEASLSVYALMFSSELINSCWGAKP